MEALTGLLAQGAPVFLLVLARVIGLTFTFPAFAAPWVPPVARAALAFGLAAAVAPAVPGIPVPQGNALPLLVVGETALGAAAGFAGQAFFAAARGAGALADLDLGFGLAQALDPASGSSEGLVARLYHILAVFVFFTLDGHLHLIGAVAGGFRRLPPGQAVLGDQALVALIAAFGKVLELAVQLALPAYAALFISTAVLAVLARAAPALGFFSLGLQIKLPVGLALLALALPYTGYVLQRMTREGQALLEHGLSLLRPGG